MSGENPFQIRGGSSVQEKIIPRDGISTISNTTKHRF